MQLTTFEDKEEEISQEYVEEHYRRLQPCRCKFGYRCPKH